MAKRLFGFKTILELLEGARWSKSGWLTSSYMVKWLLREKVPEEIFATGSVCVPIVERSPDVLKVLAQDGKLTKQHLELVWQCSIVNNDETTRLAIYKLITDTSIYLREDDLEFIFAQVDAIPPSKLLEPTVILVHDLAKSAAYKVPELSKRSLR
jgi:hypothetical protein